MKHAFKSAISMLCLLAVMLSARCIASLSASTEEVVPCSLILMSIMTE